MDEYEGSTFRNLDKRYPENRRYVRCWVRLSEYLLLLKPVAPCPLIIAISQNNPNIRLTVEQEVPRKLWKILGFAHLNNVNTFTLRLYSGRSGEWVLRFEG